MFENSRRGRQARNFGKNVPKILDLKSSSEQIFSENCRWVPLKIGKLVVMWKDINKALYIRQLKMIMSQNSEIKSSSKQSMLIVT